MRIRAGSYRVCSRIDEGERLVLVITINTGNDVRDTVSRCLDRGLHGESRMHFRCTDTESAANNCGGGVHPSGRIHLRRQLA